jgi:hypothetical protein
MLLGLPLCMLLGLPLCKRQLPVVVRYCDPIAIASLLQQAQRPRACERAERQ